ncbi:hypothetical protein MLD38_010484 [Melastoma candidum]|uniref:Uncharacterized protein n=1 Tax=Melastoma candidum TaxID=119954 RepID=A0ACB9R433_9MYRT|nr:hypothetical protein MLD38_010484 [Melastoma candidum]
MKSAVCHGPFRIPCQLNISHWFCGNGRVYAIWLFCGSMHNPAAWFPLLGDCACVAPWLAIQPCKCPLCRRENTVLVPAEASTRQRDDPGAAEVLKKLREEPGDCPGHRRCWVHWDPHGRSAPQGGFKVSIIDNLDNSVPEAVDRVRELVGDELSKNLQFHLGDLRNRQDLEDLFSQRKFDAVIHFAGLKAVGESVANPRRYFDNNLIGTINLYEVMAKYDCKKMVFSSSATVYGQPEKVPCIEDFELRAMNPYGRTKLFLEEIARDIQKAEPEWRIILLRYFNPVGAHESGKIGEDPKGIPNNLMPYIQQVAVGRLPELNVYGHDYPTRDGSAIRDYIHVMDLADGHIAALRKLFVTEDIGCTAYNLGTGCGTSVLEMVAAFEKASGKKIPIKLCPRRPGDATAVFASTEKAEKELGWKAKYGVEEMCRDQWNWASKTLGATSPSLKIPTCRSPSRTNPV